MDQTDLRKVVHLLPATPFIEGLIAADPGSSVALATSFALNATTDAPKTKRVVVDVACDDCRRRKAKCDSIRPSCGHCVKRKTKCIYRANKTSDTPTDLKRKHNHLEIENADYRELLTLLRDKPALEADDILRRVRESRFPLRVFQAFKQAELLISDPSSNERLGNAQLTRLDESSLYISAIKVHARPWTTVIDDGLMSELITNLFIWDCVYCFPCLDRVAFVEDMASGDVKKAKWCSPLLVNAICALRCQYSERAKLFAARTQQDLSERFLEESKGLLSRENGRPSIPTVQALVFMYLATAVAGKDRAARVYRFTAFTLLRRLRLEDRFNSLNDENPEDAKERRVISCALWGLFAMESRIALYYSQPSIMPPPKIPKLLEGYKTMKVERVCNVNVLGQPFKPSNGQIPLVDGTGFLSCVLAELWHELMGHINSEETIRGSNADVRARRMFYSRLRQFREELPPRFLYEENFTPLTCFLRWHENEVIYTLLLHLPFDTVFDTPYNPPNTTVKDILLQTCREDTALAEMYLRKWPFSAMVTRVISLTMLNLIPILDDPKTHDLFTTDCKLSLLSTRATKLAGLLLQAALALAWAMKKQIPEAARPYLEDWGPEAVAKDLPIAYVVPQLEEIKEMLASDPDADVTGVENHLAFLIEKWAAM
ncbi:hypothetical protein B0J13DRAFT_157389 [Dactylonectria estremocensis]|uniref:Zn(2)-C6 fungal-type domain-containing protein n=1 Tax=Dactylonectria estremocensis TaxID=1079267 RepID=A0A9P9DN43_9HYPO|nr:hypothetical protein B0J13DRAFT_157389 [Dactylonectria estremocensis]